MRRLANGNDVVDEPGAPGASGTLAIWMCFEVLSPQALPVPIISSGTGSGSPGIGLGFALPCTRGRQRTKLTRLVNAAAETAGTRSAIRHQATGLAPPPRIALVPTATLVPETLVTTQRTYRFVPT